MILLLLMRHTSQITHKTDTKYLYKTNLNSRTKTSWESLINRGYDIIISYRHVFLYYKDTLPYS